MSNAQSTVLDPSVEQQPVDPPEEQQPVDPPEEQQPADPPEEQRPSQTTYLCRQFLAIAGKKLSGTLVVSNTEGAYRSFLFHEGAIADLDTDRENELLTEGVLDTGEVNARTLRKAEKISQKHGLVLGGVLLEMNAVSEELVLETFEASVADEMTEVLSWDLDEFLFTPHSPAETLEGFRRCLSDYFDLRADPEELFLEACHRLDLWELIQSNFDILRDVFYATPGTFHYFREPDTYANELCVLGSIDGMKDVEEVVRESNLDPFEAMKIVRLLVQQGEIELVNPVQMFQIGTDLAEEGSLEKAYKLLLRAKERGLNDFDLERRIAQTLDRLGRRTEATRWYLDYATSCLAQLRSNEAIDSLRRVAEIDPDHEIALDKLLEIYVQQKRKDEALEVALQIAGRHESQGRHSAALSMLVDLEPRLRGLSRFHEKVVELAEVCNEPEIAREEKQLLAETFDEHEDVQQALEAYQNMFCAGDDGVEVRLKLIALHRKQGNRQKAIDHVNALLSAAGTRGVQNAETLLTLHTTMLELKPGDSRSSSWLVDRHLETDERDLAIDTLKGWRDELEREEDHEELVGVLEKLTELEGDDADHWSLATTFEKLGRTEDCQRELRRLASLARGERRFDEAARALDRILEKSPLDIETRKAQADLLDARGEKQLAVETLKDIATLETLAGHVQEAEEYCRRVLVADPKAADVVDRLGVLCLESGDRRKAVEQFLKAARIHLDSRDQGRARRTLGRLLELDACNPEGTRLLDELDRLETHPGPTRVDRTPAGSCAAPPRQPFQTPPAIVKTSVSGITTRLRDLKSNDSSDGHTVKGLGDIAAKLKGLGSPSSNDGAAATNTKSDEERAGTSTPPAPVPPPVDSPQDLLLELPETPPSNDPQQTPGQAPATACIEQKLGSAASRLAALREGS